MSDDPCDDWDDWENVARELLAFDAAYGNARILPTYSDLRKAGRPDLIEAISKHGGIKIVAEKLGFY